MRSNSMLVMLLVTVFAAGCSRDPLEAGMAAGTVQGTVPDLSGTWVINRELSRLPRPVAGRARMWRGGDSATRSARIAEIKSRMTPEDSVRFQTRRAQLQARMAERGISPDSLRRALRARIRDASDRGVLTITQTPTSVTIGGGRRAMTLSTDGTPALRAAGEKTVTTTAKWIDEALVVERSLPGRGAVTTVHRLSPDGQRLTSTTTISRPGGETRSFTVVRDRK